MVFRPHQRRQTLDLSIKIDKNNIECVKETVFLGVILDEHLSWKPQENIKINRHNLQIKFLPSKNLLAFFVL